MTTSPRGPVALVALEAIVKVGPCASRALQAVGLSFFGEIPMIDPTFALLRLARVSRFRGFSRLLEYFLIISTA